MEDCVKKEDYKEDHKSLCDLLEKIDRGVFGYVDENGVKHDGLIDATRQNAEAIKKILSFRNAIIGSILFVFGLLVRHAIGMIF